MPKTTYADWPFMEGFLPFMIEGEKPPFYITILFYFHRLRDLHKCVVPTVEHLVPYS